MHHTVQYDTKFSGRRSVVTAKHNLSKTLNLNSVGGSSPTQLVLNVYVELNLLAKCGKDF